MGSVVWGPTTNICVAMDLSAISVESFRVCQAAIDNMRKKIVDLRAKLPMAAKLLKEQTKMIRSSCLDLLPGDSDGLFESSFDSAFVDAVSEVLDVNNVASSLKCRRQLVASFAELGANIR